MEGRLIFVVKHRYAYLVLRASGARWTLLGRNARFTAVMRPCVLRTGHLRRYGYASLDTPASRISNSWSSDPKFLFAATIPLASGDDM